MKQKLINHEPPTLSTLAVSIDIISIILIALMDANGRMGTSPHTGVRILPVDLFPTCDDTLRQQLTDQKPP